MNKLSSILGIALITFICACGDKSVKPKQGLIVGKWKLQTQQIATYINDIPQVYSAGTTDKSTASILFSSDGTYTASAAFALNGSLISLGESGSAGYVGKYTLTDSVLTMQPFFRGSFWLDTLLLPSTAITVINKIVTETATIRQLNSSLLTFDTKIVVFQTADKKTRTITTKTTYNYTR
jgi:hypothetical protein